MRARLATILPGRLDPIWVDALVAAVLLAISLVRHLGAASSARGRSRRLWCRRQSRVGSGGPAPLAVVALLGGGSRRGGQVGCTETHRTRSGPGGIEGSLLALLLFYGGGAYLDGWRSMRWRLWSALRSRRCRRDRRAASGRREPVWNDVVIGVLPWFVGRMMRERSARSRAPGERAERLDAEHEMHARVAALAERARLAREIHDVIAHSVSVMVIQAAGARTVMDARAGARRGGAALGRASRPRGAGGDAPAARRARRRRAHARARAPAGDRGSRRARLSHAQGRACRPRSASAASRSRCRPGSACAPTGWCRRR